jgi:hypothetical protein
MHDAEPAAALPRGPDDQAPWRGPVRGGFDICMMVIHVNLELQQSIDVFLPRIECISKILTEPGSKT